MSAKKNDQAEILKELIRQLHAGASPQEVKERFKELLDGVGPEQIAQIEQKLIAEGLPREEVHRLCDVHLAVFQDSVEKQAVDAPPGHPLHTFMEEHQVFLRYSQRLADAVDKLSSAGDEPAAEKELARVRQMASLLEHKESHNIREENVLFPYLEKHGVTEPPAIMWTEHNEMREKMKRLQELLKTGTEVNFPQLKKNLLLLGKEIHQALSSHVYKENHILYPLAMKAIAAPEWEQIRRQCDQLGYSVYSPSYLQAGTVAPDQAAAQGEPGTIPLSSGPLSVVELEAMLNALPVDISFVDKDDKVRYFNETADRIFPRTRAVIGRAVQQCHPQKSVHLVNQILDDFRGRRREAAEFWIQMGERLIYIRYFPVRDLKGEYLGCLEVTQDIAAVKKIEGEKRLL